jgi:hypothetical protein
MLAGNVSRSRTRATWSVVLAALVLAGLVAPSGDAVAEPAAPARFRSAPSVNFATPDPLTGRGMATAAATCIAPVGEQRLAALASDALGSPAGLAALHLRPATALAGTISLQSAPRATMPIASVPAATAVLAPMALSASGVRQTAGFQLTMSGAALPHTKPTPTTRDVVARSWATGETSNAIVTSAPISLFSVGTRDDWNAGVDPHSPALAELNAAPLLGERVPTVGSIMGPSSQASPRAWAPPAAMGSMLHASPRR